MIHCSGFELESESSDDDLADALLVDMEQGVTNLKLYSTIVLARLIRMLDIGFLQV